MKRILMFLILGLVIATIPADAMVVSGTVTDSASGAVLSNVYVALRSSSSTLVRDTTDENGTYSISFDSAGTYTLRAIDLDENHTQTSVAITIGTDDQTVDLVMQQAVTVTITGKVTDTANGAIAGAVVVYTSSSSSSSRKSDTTDTEGNYSIGALQTGTYKVSVSAEGFVTKSDSLTVTDASDQTASFALTPKSTGTVSGTITGASGDVVANAVVTVKKSSSSMTAGSSSSKKYDTTAADGTYRFDGLETGTYKLTVSADGYSEAADSITIEENAYLVKDVQLAEETYAKLAGTVTDSSGGEKLSGATVVLFADNDTVAAATTADDGTYSFDSVAGGDYSVIVAAAGYLEKSTSVTVSGTAEQTMDVAMTKIVYCSVSGKITDSTTGAALAGVTVLLRWTSGTQEKATLDSTVTDTDGYYTLDSAFTGAYVRSSPDGYARKSVDLIVTSTEQQTVDLALSVSTGAAVKYVVTERAAAGLPAIAVTSGGMICIRNVQPKAMVQMFDLRGKLLGGITAVSATNDQLLLQTGKLPTGYVVVRVVQNGTATVQKIFIR